MLYLLYVFRLEALLSLDDSELNFLPFLQWAVPIAFDGTEMNKYIVTVFATDEAEAFGVVEPLYSARFFLWQNFLLDRTNYSIFKMQTNLLITWVCVDNI